MNSRQRTSMGKAYEIFREAFDSPRDPRSDNNHEGE